MRARFFVQQKAFTPCQTREIDAKAMEKVLTKLYQSDPVYEHVSEKNAYQAQLDTLIDTLCGFIPAEVIDSDERIRPAVDRMKEDLKNRDYAAGTEEEKGQYFRIYKKNLESITYLISEWEKEKKYKFVLKFWGKIVVCAAGAFTQLEQSLFELTAQQDINTWLAEFRKNILHVWAESYIAQRGIREGMSIHVHLQCLKIAAKNKWNIPVTKNTAQDQYEDQVKLSEDDILDMELFFAEQYSREAIINNVTFNVKSWLAPYKNQKMKYDINHDVLKVFDMFGFDKEEDLPLDGDTVSITDKFWANLSLMVEQFLENEDYIKRRTDYLQKYFVAENVLTSIVQERDRLKEKYGRDHQRVRILNQLMDITQSAVEICDDKEAVTLTTSSINTILLDYPHIDIYKGWAKTFGLILLNILIGAPVLPCVIKYAFTGSCFFSLRGKTHDTLSSTVTKLENFQTPSIS